jgi:hypothetical protein
MPSRSGYSQQWLCPTRPLDSLTPVGTPVEGSVPARRNPVIDPKVVALPHERYVACMRCAVEHPDDAATPIAAYGAYDAPWDVDRLWPVTRIREGRVPGRGPLGAGQRQRSYWRTAVEAEAPFAESPTKAVPLRCRRCGLLIGPISAKRVGQLFAEGADHDGVLLLPRPAPGVEAPRPRRVSVEASGSPPGV